MSVALVLFNDQQESELLRWGAYFGRALGRKLLVFRPVQAPGSPQNIEIPNPELPSFELPDNPDGGETPEDPLQVSCYEVRSSAPGAEILRLIRKHKCRLLVIPNQEPQTLRRFLFRHSNCDALLIAPRDRAAGDETQSGHRILVPVSGGANARGALRIARKVAESHDVRVDALFVQPRIGDDADSVGRRIVNKLVTSSLAGQPGRVEGKVIVANQPLAAIADMSRHGYDLLMIGSSNLNPLRRVFGTIPGQLLANRDCPTVAVFRQAIPLTTRLEQVIIRGLRRFVPQLDRESRIELVARVQSNSQFNFDFVTLVCLSTLIAALGLIRNSAAVVIGAMLVAPLMTPLLGCGLALVHGNLVLVRNALRAVLLGFLLSFVMGYLLGWLVPGVALNDEILARGNPNLIDLAIAFASGVAAAYATARPGLSGALAGVAIAAALVPPIACTGMGVALGAWWLALGALTLFFTNIVAIVLGAGLSLYALGLRGDHTLARRQLWIRHATVTLIFVCAILAIPLSYALYRSLPGARVPGPIQEKIRSELQQEPAITVVSIGQTSNTRGATVIRVAVSAPRVATVADVARVREILREHGGTWYSAIVDSGTEPIVQIATTLVVESPATGEVPR